MDKTKRNAIGDTSLELPERPWEHWEAETDQQYKSFQYFCGLIGDKPLNLQQVATAMNYSASYVKRMRKEYRWVYRKRLYTVHRDRIEELVADAAIQHAEDSRKRMKGANTTYGSEGVAMVVREFKRRELTGELSEWKPLELVAAGKFFAGLEKDAVTLDDKDVVEHVHTISPLGDWARNLALEAEKNPVVWVEPTGPDRMIEEINATDVEIVEEEPNE